jgi:hypothetical protein
VKNSRISLVLKALRELGPRKLVLFVLYKVGLKTGYFKWKTGDEIQNTEFPRHLSSAIRPLLDLPDPDTLLEIIGADGLSQLKAEADEIVAGRARLFGGKPVPLNLTPPGKLSHWTDYALGKPPFSNHQATQLPHLLSPDTKFVWEPARFGWAFTLGRAYLLTRDERYPEAFWRYFEIFQQANPVNQGPNWESAQEVALRLIAFVFAAQVYADSVHSTENRKSKIGASIASHAIRIPPTLIYARSQNNNHLLSEAAGLITASLALPEHLQAKRWSKLGWKWFRCGLQTQIAEDGAYMQQSTNYHRLMLQLVLWVNQVSGNMRENKQPATCNLLPVLPNLQLATNWLQALCDPESGRVPNLGPNDSAYILPLTVQSFHDYRPVLQAASRAFLEKSAFTPGAWDEMSLWLCSSAKVRVFSDQDKNLTSDTRHLIPSTLRTPHAWAYLRAAHFRDRPGHADQLHLDMWWRGLNVAQDAGTYLYNADPPWGNALTHTAVHNTVMMDNRQQMTSAGRFLYLDWAQAGVLKREGAGDGSWERVVARHDGYQRLGAIHQRSVIAYQDERWIIEDQLLPASRSPLTTPHTARLHWLLPDWKWKVNDSRLTIEIQSPYGWVELAVSCRLTASSLQLVRAGELLHGAGETSSTWGWVSPTYGVKTPALSFVVTAVGELPLTLTTEWRFPG